MVNWMHIGCVIILCVHDNENQLEIKNLHGTLIVIEYSPSKSY